MDVIILSQGLVVCLDQFVNMPTELAFNFFTYLDEVYEVHIVFTVQRISKREAAFL